jgi:aminoglycoside phosphotransferase (APT) family kinase protein
VLDSDTIKARLEQWLPNHLGADPVTVTEVAPPIGNGYSSVTLLFTAEWKASGATQQRKFVARLEPDRPGVFPEYDVELQFEIMQTLHERTNIPVPIPLWQERNASVLGAPFFVMSHMIGRVPSDNPPYTLEGWILDEPPERQRTLYMSGLEQMAHIHNLDVEPLFGRLEPRLRVGIDEEFAYYERYFEWAAEGTAQPVAEKAWEWLQANKPKGWLPKGISWGDSRISNMIFGDDLHPVAVLDWEMMSINDSEMDLGWWLFLDRHFSTGMGVENPPGFPKREETIARWEELTDQPADHLEFWEVYGGFRFAVVMIRVVHLMIEDGVMPPDTDYGRNNIVTQVLAEMLGLPHPSELG